MMWFLLFLAVYVVMGFFTVRMTVIDLATGGKIESGLWAFALFLGAVPILGWSIALMCSGSKRKAFFMPPKKVRVKQPYVRKALGKVFLIKE